MFDEGLQECGSKFCLVYGKHCIEFKIYDFGKLNASWVYFIS